ncbi:ECs1072 family phage-associated protein [Serratia quinivorans]|uniref:ECs1072 family phage-associated protein n=1 Tax=Serratia quinivorans TaxID=137545 RepID=UPI003F9D380A
MEISLTNYFGLFTNTYQNVLKTLEIDDDGVSLHSDKENYLSERALIIFKLDFLLFEYKQENDPHRLVLKGKNALVSYLVNNKKIPLGDAKNATLSDALVLLSGELRELKISDEIMSQLKKGDFNFNDYPSWKFVSKYPGYQDDEWDPDLWDKHLLK